MTHEDLVRFARRDWKAIAHEKAAYWIGRKRRLAPAELLALGDDLRRHAANVRPDWPTEAERAADQSTHVRVTEALRAVARLRPR